MSNKQEPCSRDLTITRAPCETSFPYKEFYTDLEGCKEFITEHGVAVVPNVLTATELEQARDGMWSLLEHMLQNSDIPFDRTKPKSWRSFNDLCPLHGMLLQHLKIGHAQFIWDIRQNEAVANVFAKIWDSQPEDLLTSFDGTSIHLPPERTKFGFFHNNLMFHVDQSYCSNEFKCIQGMVTLWDCEEKDATLACWPGSHKVHADFGAKFGLNDPTNHKHLANWQKMGGDPEKYAWLESKGMAPCCVKAKAGSLILWDSRTMHQGIQSVIGRKTPKPRCVAYVCMLPRSGIGTENEQREETLQKKRELLEEGRMTSHWPYPVSTMKMAPRTRGKNIDHLVWPDKATLTPLGRRLAGFDT